VLVLAGGFGMVQQRNELQAEIRELRARLATAPSADALVEAKAEQDSLRAQNSELATAYSALQQEAERLQSAISGLRSAQEAAQKSAQTARAAPAKPAATAPAAQASTQRAAAPSGGSWFVNFAAYRDEATAKRWADRLKVSGGKVEVQPTTSDGRPLYRVRVSQIASRTEATRIARALEQEHNVSSLWVGQQ
jgi:cell division septation protein DedD